MKVGDLVVYCESVTGIVTWLPQMTQQGHAAIAAEARVLLSDSGCEEWCEVEALRVINESR